LEIANPEPLINPLKKAWIDYLEPYDWQWFCTLTFAGSTHPEKCSKAFRHWINQINRKIYGTGWQNKGGGLYWILALEYHKDSRIHFHALLGDSPRDLNELFSRKEASALWHGYSKIEVPNKKNIVINYVCKYVVKGGELTPSPNLNDFTKPLTLINSSRDKKTAP
tara:strand:+ start:52525 stop:53022 length:498 start_codon:yes stop_codon:yes gene_type:complete